MPLIHLVYKHAWCMQQCMAGALEPSFSHLLFRPSATNSKRPHLGGGSQAGKAKAAQAADTGAEGAKATSEPPLTKKQQKKVDKQVGTGVDCRVVGREKGFTGLWCAGCRPACLALLLLWHIHVRCVLLVSCAWLTLQSIALHR